VKVGDYIRPKDRKRQDEVFLVESIELDIDEEYLARGGTKQLAAMPILRLKAPPGSPYEDRILQSPWDFEVMVDWSPRTMTRLKASWRKKTGGVR
jgi:hypothetical protein